MFAEFHWFAAPSARAQTHAIEERLLKYGAFPPGLRFYECILDRDLILASD
jgi:hypothetical protein